MKTKKFIVYVLISLFVFSPFLNFESWATGTRVPIKQTLPETRAGVIECRWDCVWIGNDYCCEKYCCSCGGNLCQITESFCIEQGDPIIK